MSLSKMVAWLSALWIFSMCASCDFQGCKTAVSIRGFRFPGHIISAHSAPSIWRCFRLCELKMPLKCHSINYNLETFQCEINNRTKNGKPHEFVSSSEYVYLENPFRGKNLQELPIYNHCVNVYKYLLIFVTVLVSVSLPPKDKDRA